MQGLEGVGVKEEVRKESQRLWEGKGSTDLQLGSVDPSTIPRGEPCNICYGQLCTQTCICIALYIVVICLLCTVSRDFLYLVLRTDSCFFFAVAVPVRYPVAVPVRYPVASPVIYATASSVLYPVPTTQLYQVVYINKCNFEMYAAASSVLYSSIRQVKGKGVGRGRDEEA